MPRRRGRDGRGVRSGPCPGVVEAVDEPVQALADRGRRAAEHHADDQRRRRRAPAGATPARPRQRRGPAAPRPPPATTTPAGGAAPGSGPDRSVNPRQDSMAIQVVAAPMTASGRSRRTSPGPPAARVHRSHPPVAAGRRRDRPTGGRARWCGRAPARRCRAGRAGRRATARQPCRASDGGRRRAGAGRRSRRPRRRRRARGPAPSRRGGASGAARACRPRLDAPRTATQQPAVRRLGQPAGVDVRLVDRLHDGQRLEQRAGVELGVAGVPGGGRGPRRRR